MHFLHFIFWKFWFFYFIQVFDQFLAILQIGPISISEDETPPVLLNVTKIIIFQISIFSVPEITIGPFTIFNSTSSYIYSVINLILPKSKQLLWHFFTNKQVDVLGDFNLEFWYILLFEVRFWIFRISFFAQNGDNSKGYPLENLKSHHLWFEKCFLITKCIKISVIKIISKLT